MKRLKFIHPFLLSFVSIFQLYAHNIERVNLADLCLPSFVSLLLLLVLLGGFRFLTKEAGKIALLVSLCLILFYTYGLVYSARTEFDIIRHRYLLLVYTGFCIGGCYLILRRLGFDLIRSINIALNIMAIVLITLPSLNIVWGSLTRINPPQADNLQIENVETANQVSVRMWPEGLPDIYYILLDERPSQAILQNVFGYNDSSFVNFLGNSGFQVLSNSNSNYPQTTMTLASCLNMDYLQSMAEAVTDQTLMKLIDSPRLFSDLKKQGYTINNIASGVFPSNSFKTADKNIKAEHIYLSPFFNLYVKNNFLCTLEYYFITIYKRAQVNFAFETLGSIVQRKGPNFYMAHIVSPHEPFVFTRDGKVPDNFSFFEACEFRNQCDSKYYIDQLIYINNSVTSLVKNIQKRYSNPPIIVIHSDHGSYKLLSELDFEHLWINPSDDMVIERMSNFCAVYCPENINYKLSSSTTPVNIWREILNAAFNYNYPILKNKSYFCGYFQEVYDFTDVTDLVFEENE